MEQATAKQMAPAALADKTAEWLRKTRCLAREAGCEQTVDLNLSRAAVMNRPLVNLGLVGGPNAGKTTVLNDLIGRSIVPVSSLPSQTEFDVLGESGPNGERFLMANRERSIADLADALKSARGGGMTVTLQLDCDWMRQAQLHVFEKGALDADDDHLTQLVDECIRNLDLAVLVIDALAPVRRADSAFLAECARRKLPLIVAISKFDKLPEEERDGVVPYVEQQVRMHFINAPVVRTGTAELKQAILSAREKTDFNRLRTIQFCDALLVALAAISTAADSCADADAGREAQVSEKIEKGTNNIEAEKVIWLKIETELASRCQKVQERFRAQLGINQESALADLNDNLDKSTDIKQWWVSDLPRLLRGQMRNTANAIAIEVDRELASDRRWLQDELKRHFGLQLVFEQHDQVPVFPQPVETRDLPLSSHQKLKIVKSVGQAAAVLSAGLLLMSAGIGGIAIGVGVLAGVGADHWLHLQTKQNKEKVRPELSHMLANASVAYVADISKQVWNWYSSIIGSIQTQQSEWNEAQFEAFKSIKTGRADSKDWRQLKARAEDLADEIKRA